MAKSKRRGLNVRGRFTDFDFAAGLTSRRGERRDAAQLRVGDAADIMSPSMAPCLAPSPCDPPGACMTEIYRSSSLSAMCSFPRAPTSSSVRPTPANSPPGPQLRDELALEHGGTVSFAPPRLPVVQLNSGIPRSHWFLPGHLRLARSSRQQPPTRPRCHDYPSCQRGTPRCRL